MRILVGSSKDYKSLAIQTAFESHFPNQPITINRFDVPSGVPRQPKNKKVFKGALNRVRRLKKLAEKQAIEYDFLAACEAGILKQADGYFYNVQVVHIYDPQKNQIFCRISSGIRVPKKLVRPILDTSISSVLNQICGTKGFMHFLTNGAQERKDHIKSATIMALADMRLEEITKKTGM